MLPIYDASRLVIGAALMANQVTATLRASSGPDAPACTAEQLLKVVAADGPQGAQVLSAIGKFAEGEPSLRRHPPHALISEKILAHRQADLRTQRAINAAIVATLELTRAAAGSDSVARQSLLDVYRQSLRDVDEVPWRPEERISLKQQLVAEVRDASPRLDFTTQLLLQAEQQYLADFMSQTLASYDPLVRSQDVDSTPH